MLLASREGLIEKRCEGAQYFLSSDLKQFRRDVMVHSRLPEIKSEKEFSDLLQGGGDSLQFASMMRDTPISGTALVYIIFIATSQDSVETPANVKRVGDCQQRR